MKTVLFKAFLAIPIAIALGYPATYVGSEMKLREVSLPPAFTYEVESDSATLAWGRHVARIRGCFGCHGQELEGRVFTKEQWPWVERAVPPNLAAFVKQQSNAALEAAIRHGIGHHVRALWSMPSYNWVHLTDYDLASMIAYMRSEKVIEKELPRPKLGFEARKNIVLDQQIHMAAWALKVPPLQYASTENDGLQRGEYLAMTTCNECHGLDLMGDVQPDFFTPPLSIISAYTQEEFSVLMATGVARDGRDSLGLMTIVAKDRFAFFTEQELKDLYAFLQTL